jgi:hypothetical protein
VRFLSVYWFVWVTAVLGMVTLWLGVPAWADEKRSIVQPDQSWSGVFGDTEAILRFTIRPTKALKGRVTWQWTSTGNRTLARGESAILAAVNQPARITIRLKVPPVKPGVILHTRLLVTVYHEGSPRAEATHEQGLTVFPTDPFVDRKQWLKDRKLTLFDPDGKTAAILTTMGIPFEETRNPAALPELRSGMILVGEGVSFREYRDLPEALFKAAARGIPVLCLAPSAGYIRLPGAEGAPLPAPKALCFRRQEVITAIDKDLDAAGWAADTELTASTLSLKADGGQVVAEVQNDPHGWPWLEVQFPATNGRCIVCTFGIVRNWDANPTPRFLLARLLERLSSLPPLDKERNAGR